MRELPAELEKYEVYLKKLSAPDNAIFVYWLFMMMHHVGRMKITKVLPANDFDMIFFETLDGATFHTIWPYLDRKTLLETMRRIQPMLLEFEQELGISPCPPT